MTSSPATKSAPDLTDKQIEELGAQLPKLTADAWEYAKLHAYNEDRYQEWFARARALEWAGSLLCEVKRRRPPVASPAGRENDLARAEDARTSVASPPTSAWRDIASAPKDGTVVDLWCVHSRPDINPPMRHANMMHVQRADHQRGPAKTGWHYTIGRVILERLADVYTPTHWMPLPLPPGEEK